MKKVDKEVLKESARKLLFDMSEEEYDTLLKEFDFIINQMEIISRIEGVDNVEPMSLPYPVTTTEMREDIAEKPLTQEEALKNAGDKKDGMIILPKVVR